VKWTNKNNRQKIIIKPVHGKDPSKEPTKLNMSSKMLLNSGGINLTTTTTTTNNNPTTTNLQPINEIYIIYSVLQECPRRLLMRPLKIEIDHFFFLELLLCISWLTCPNR
jgi:hypothetical protein